MFETYCLVSLYHMLFMPKGTQGPWTSKYSQRTIIIEIWPLCQQVNLYKKSTFKDIFIQNMRNVHTTSFLSYLDMKESSQDNMHTLNYEELKVQPYLTSYQLNSPLVDSFIESRSHLFGCFLYCHWIENHQKLPVCNTCNLVSLSLCLVSETIL